MDYSYFVKARCPHCGGNVICYTDHVPDVLANLRTYECMMCCRDVYPAQLVSFKGNKVLATEKRIDDESRLTSAWESSSTALFGT